MNRVRCSKPQKVGVRFARNRWRTIVGSAVAPLGGLLLVFLAALPGAPVPQPRVFAQGSGACPAGLVQVTLPVGQITAYTVPAGVTALRILAAAGSGGDKVSGSVGGAGAVLAGTVQVTPNQVLRVLVGSEGDGSGISGGGGGGASYVGRGADNATAFDSANLILVAGAGGGASAGTAGGAGGTPDGGDGAGAHPGRGGEGGVGGGATGDLMISFPPGQEPNPYPGTQHGGGAEPGDHGEDVSSLMIAGGGGGGLGGNGGNALGATGGAAAINGGIGGSSFAFDHADPGLGGFGGGGGGGGDFSGTGDGGGGGGGGYAGGGGGQDSGGGGGSSFFGAGVTSTSMAATNNGNGYVTLCEVRTVFSEEASTATGLVAGDISGGGSTCSLTNVVARTVAEVAGTGPANQTLPHGLIDFHLAACQPGATVTFEITYPSPLLPGTQYWKYGPTSADPSPHWYTLPASISGNTASFSVTDGGLGDDDLAANGVIQDPGGPGFALAAVPTMPIWMLLILSVLLLVAAGSAKRFLQV